jgi:hypothetical protein
LSYAHIFITYFLISHKERNTKNNGKRKKKETQKTKEHKKGKRKTKKHKKQKEKQRNTKNKAKKKNQCYFIPGELYPEFARDKLTGGSWSCFIAGEFDPEFARGNLCRPTCHRDNGYPQ